MNNVNIIYIRATTRGATRENLMNNNKYMQKRVL